MGIYILPDTATLLPHVIVFLWSLVQYVYSGYAGITLRVEGQKAVTALCLRIGIMIFIICIDTKNPYFMICVTTLGTIATRHSNAIQELNVRALRGKRARLLLAMVLLSLCSLSFLPILLATVTLVCFSCLFTKSSRVSFTPCGKI